jgi:hypothetical protein
MAKQEILDQLSELLNIPQFERIIFHKVEELKLYLKDEIDLYRSLKNHFKKSAYGDMQLCESEGATEKAPQSYHFELNLNEDGQWVVAGLEPEPPLGYGHYDIVPEEVIRHMVTTGSDPDKIETHRGFTLPEIKDRAFDLRYTRYSDHHILGTLQSYATGEPSAAEYQDETADPDQLTEIYNYQQHNADDESNFKELFYYMQKYPALKTYFFTELHMKMKPLIIGNLVEVTASSRPVDLF